MSATVAAGNHPDRPTKDVQDKLRQSFRSRRAKGKVPYPVKYSHSQLAYDNWNQMFLSTLTQEPGKESITMHQFESPPKRVLDLGCGSGFWILEAATKHWKETTFVGLDVLEHQPKFGKLFGKSADDLTQRIQWVKANFLEGLPFDSDSFDFVRICGLGLAIPEDEWQNLLQEVRRILEPGGVVEVIEEDLIFPSSIPIKNHWMDSSYLSPHHTNTPYSNSFAAPSTSSIMDHSFSLSSALGSSSPPPRFNDPDDMSPDSSIDTQTMTDASTVGRSSDNSSGKAKADYDHMLDPQDHSKLKEAFQNMLHRRFLAPRLTAVLPFYISSEFDDMQTHPPLHVCLPPNSEQGSFTQFADSWSSGFGSRSDPDLRVDLQNQSVRISTDVGEIDEVSVHSRRSTTMSQRAAMHLARAVNLIEGCKDAIWEEYYLSEKAKEKPKDPKPKEHIRQAFEQSWSNWDNDMKDRMCMRGTVTKWLSWSIPDTERPDWRVWRDRVNPVESDALSLSSGLNPIDGEFCRSLRGFVAWNTMGEGPEI